MKYIYKINEFRNQLEIPFDTKHPLYDKPPHIHLLDRLEDISNELKIKPENYYSNWNEVDIDKVWENNLDSAFTVFLTEEDGDDIDRAIATIFLDKYDIITNQDLFNDEIKNYIKDNPKCTSKNIIKEFDLYDYLSNYTDIKNEKLKIIDLDIRKIIFNERLDDNDVLDIIKNKLNKDGLLPVYRAITVNHNGDLYSELKSKYNGVGIYWSYDITGADPHWGTHNGWFILHGLIKPEYINWVNTITKSVYSLNYEKEIEINEKSPILINKISQYKSTFVRNDGSYKDKKLKNQLVVIT